MHNGECNQVYCKRLRITNTRSNVDKALNKMSRRQQRCMMDETVTQPGRINWSLARNKFSKAQDCEATINVKPVQDVRMPNVFDLRRFDLRRGTTLSYAGRCDTHYSRLNTAHARSEWKLWRASSYVFAERPQFASPWPAAGVAGPVDGCSVKLSREWRTVKKN